MIIQLVFHLAGARDSLKEKQERAKLQSLLESLDVDGDGNIDESELLKAIETLVGTGI